ncbi:MAG: hypothetical protein GY830_04200 [Bacteroidetes bacterium]|nr:hypothetical protein [Bacteroidota bacterium]
MKLFLINSKVLWGRYLQNRKKKTSHNRFKYNIEDETGDVSVAMINYRGDLLWRRCKSPY